MDLQASLSDFPTVFYSKSCRVIRPGVARRGWIQSMPPHTVQEIVDITIGFLANHQGRSVGEVYEELAARGQELPVDSVLVMEILTRVEQRFDVSIPADAEAGRSLRSVWAFAETVYDTMQAEEQEE
ncbi:acyl carrier protein [Streptomyces sp. NPDC059534]|uniref:acyl carrier protein n=1 Tax=Streptomyces sp. NPDC059534 TaxID=3346859 RepID=UPI0036CBCE64